MIRDMAHVLFAVAFAMIAPRGAARERVEIASVAALQGRGVTLPRKMCTDQSVLIALSVPSRFFVKWNIVHAGTRELGNDTQPVSRHPQPLWGGRLLKTLPVSVFLPFFPASRRLLLLLLLVPAWLRACYSLDASSTSPPWIHTRRCLRPCPHPRPPTTTKMETTSELAVTPLLQRRPRPVLAPPLCVTTIIQKFASWRKRCWSGRSVGRPLRRISPTTNGARYSSRRTAMPSSRAQSLFPL